MNDSFFVFMNNNKVFAILERHPGPLNDLLTAAFASNVQGMMITDYPHAQCGDIWDGSKFVKMSEEKEPATDERLALLVDNEVVDIMDLETHYPYFDRWVKGFSKEHVGFNATGYENVRAGSTWDGVSFTLPKSII